MQHCPICNYLNRPTAHFCAYCRAPLLLQNRYRITRLLGRGGFGAVYLAEQLHLGGVPCAIKEMQPPTDATQQEIYQYAQQFQFEATLLARLSHPMLPRVTNFFVEGNRYYLAMDHVEGETLEEYRARNHTPLPETLVVTWAGQLCDVLMYLHAQQPPVIHRDIKPSNIKVLPDGRLKLIDFGIAKLLARGVGTADAARAVSRPYSPLEQYGKGQGTDGRSDIYALGVTLYELLTGHLPPEAPDRRTEAVIPLRQWNPALSPTVEAAVLRAIADRPEDRFQNAVEMKKALMIFAPAPWPPALSPYAPPPLPAASPYNNPLPVFKPTPSKSTNVWAWVLGLAAVALVLAILLPSGYLLAHQLGQVTGQATTPAQVQITGTAIAQTQATTQPAARAGATTTANAQATATAQANATGTAYAQAAAATNATATAYWQAAAATNAAATAYWQAAAATHATATAQAQATVRARAIPILRSLASPFKDLTFGRGGTNTNCQIAQNVATVNQAALIDDAYFYFAMPFQATDVGKRIYWSVYDPDSKPKMDKIERDLTTDQKLCFWQGFAIDPLSKTGPYTLEITSDNQVVYRIVFTVEYADIASRRPQRNPFGQFAFGRGGWNESACGVTTPTDSAKQSDLSDDPWFYFASPYTVGDVGQLYQWTVYRPDGSVAFDHVERTLGDNFWLCAYQGFSLSNSPAVGNYKLVIEYKSQTIYQKIFAIQ